MKLLHGFVVAALALSAAAWAPARDASAQQLTLYGAGATFPAPLYQRWIEAFQAKRQDLSLNYAVVGSGEGVSRFLAGAVDFGASDVPMSATDVAKAKSGVVQVPATAGMVVLAYNLPGLPATLKLPADVYAGIFSGAITTWDDPAIKAANPNLTLPHRNIAVIVRQDSSGTTHAFTNHLKAASPVWAERGLSAGKVIAWPGAVMQARGNEGVAGRIRISDWSIGYVEYGFAKRLGLPMATLRNAEGQYVMPTDDSGTQALNAGTAKNGGDPLVSIPNPPGAASYPIVTYSWLLLHQNYADAAHANAVRDFVRYGLGEGQAAGSALGYIALPEAVAAKGLDVLSTVH